MRHIRSLFPLCRY